MKHWAIPSFWSRYNRLPPEVRDLSDKAFALLADDPRHPSLPFKKVGKLWSIRVSREWRALALEEADGLHWFWIGSHGEYDRLIG